MYNPFYIVLETRVFERLDNGAGQHEITTAN
jgi:hypothetical protein